MSYIAYLTSDFAPATKEQAKFAKVVTDDGKCYFLLLTDDEIATEPEGEENEPSSS